MMSNLKYYVMFALCLQNMYGVAVNARQACRTEYENYRSIGCGTYPLKGIACYAAVKCAIEMGCVIIDTATFYENFDGIAAVLQEFNRSDLYIISKVWPNAHDSKRLYEDLLSTLQKMGTTYLDAYLLHWPNSAVPIEETLDAMYELQKCGLVRHIGVSNVSVNHLKRILEYSVPITWVQIEMHPNFCDFELLNFCRAHGIAIQAWAPLGRGRLSSNAFLADIGKKYHKTASQVALRWIVQHGCVPLPCSQNAEHIRQNMDIFDFVLSSEEMDKIDAQAKKGSRERVSIELGLGFADEFDFTYEECWPRQLNTASIVVTPY